MEEESGGLWIQGILALLEPLACQSSAIARLLAAEVSVFCRLLTVSSEPLSLSLGTTTFEAIEPSTLAVLDCGPANSPWHF